MIVCADARRIPLADGSVQCIVTSPPYWGLRRYAGEQELVWGGDVVCPHEWVESSTENRDIRTGLGLAEWSKVNARGGGLKPAKVGSFTIHSGTCTLCGAWLGAYGLEPTIEMYVEHTVEILRECRRVLRKDGVLFWNIGDSYCSGAFTARTRESADDQKKRGLPHNWCLDENKIMRNGKPDGLKPKDLVLMPFRVALAAQADGWWVRSVIAWAKPNPMPESVADRPTDSYEHILMLTRSAKYFWDAEAVREPVSGTAHDRGHGVNPKALMHNATRVERAREGQKCEPTDLHNGIRPRQNESFSAAVRNLVFSRNMRNFWDFATQPYRGAHFATFPEELPRRCITAATSQKGACAQCGAPWTRRVKIQRKNAKPLGKVPSGWHQSGTERMHPDFLDRPKHRGQCGDGAHPTESVVETQTIGWRPSCKCHCKELRPCIVLDPFAGSGTTGRVSIELNRTPVLLDLAYARATAEDKAKHREYERLAQKRTRGVQRTLAL